uniref:DUF5094 domain-containing protein n=1 Tax=Caenorhabditis tropicalis TaxID=1561998 RepID=A0A1I7UQW1_9PELO
MTVRFSQSKLVRGLISFISTSKKPDSARWYAVNTLENLNCMTKYLKFYPEEAAELDEMKMEMIETRDYYRNVVNESEVNLRWNKIVAMVMWICGLLMYIVFKIEKKDAEKPEEDDHILNCFITTVILFYLGVLYTGQLYSRKENQHSDDNSPDEMTSETKKNLMGNNENLRMSDGELSRLFLKEQIKVIDLFWKQVFPLKKKSIQLNDSRIRMKIISIIPLIPFLITAIYYSFIFLYDAYVAFEKRLN